MFVILSNISLGTLKAKTVKSLKKKLRLCPVTLALLGQGLTRGD